MTLRRMLMLAGMLAVCGCSGTSIQAVFSVARQTEPGTLTQGLDLVPRHDALDVGPQERISFTPASLKLQLRGVYLCEHVEYISGIGTACPSSKPQIEVTGTPAVVELAGQAAMSNLLSFSTSVGADHFGTYRGVMLLYGQEGSADLTMSATVKRANGDTGQLTDLVVPMGTSGIGIDMSSPVTLAEGSSAVVKVFFDVEWAADLSHSTASPMSAAIPGTDLTATVDHLILLPYVGTADPTVERYQVTLTTDAFGASKWYLKVVVLRDAQGDVAAGGWHTVFVDGFSHQGPTFEPGPLYASALEKNGDGTWNLKEDDARSFTPASNRLVFPAFALNDHQGTLTLGGTSYAYTATKLP